MVASRLVASRLGAATFCSVCRAWPHSDLNCCHCCRRPPSSCDGNAVEPPASCVTAYLLPSTTAARPLSAPSQSRLIEDMPLAGQKPLDVTHARGTLSIMDVTGKLQRRCTRHGREAIEAIGCCSNACRQPQAFSLCLRIHVHIPPPQQLFTHHPCRSPT
ncbi:hypothetical protein EDB81DRAFT_780646 [Dactylonectria macrodidyma]|uniref:Uncharacterized protein n=1 Tax=Dactylonectria macrodidyma TaxID=307937 RepID=A0A9P9FMI8_9HYPO|nr:hypothetical protein EDB81DRAFT_780646 [Dactylonectria macrodidyma]